MIAALSLATATLSLKLDDAIALALQRNLTYQAAQADARRARGELTSAHAAFLPTLDVNGGRQTLSDSAVPTIRFLYPLPGGGAVPETARLANSTTDEFGAAARIVFYNGAISAQVGEVTAQYVGSIQTIAATRADVINSTTAAFYSLLAAERNAAIARDAQKIANDDVRVARQRFAAGVAARADLLREQLSAADAASAAIDADATVQTAQASLANVLDVEDGSAIEPVDPLDEPLPDFDEAQLLARARLLRPELHVAQAAVDAAAYAVRAARATALPTVALGADESDTHPSTLGVAQPQLETSLTATWRLFDGGLTRGNVVAAQAGVDAADIRLHDLRNNVDLEVRTAYASYSSAVAKLDSAAAATRFAAESLRVTRIRFKAGVGTALELSDAVLADEQSRTAYVDARVGARTALVSLRRATGEL